MKKLVLILVVLFAFSGCNSGDNQSETHLNKLDWQKQLADAQKNNDYGTCQDVVIAAFLDNNLTVLNKAADICWPMAKNDRGVKSAMDFMDVKTKEDYINMVGATMNKTLKPEEQK